MTKYLLNIATHDGDLALIEHDWGNAEAILQEHGFDGFELYPVGDYPFESIPASLITGVHLRFFPIIEPLWCGRQDRLLQVYGSMDVVRHVYGGCGPEAVVECYRRQLALAHALGCQYVVLHMAQCEFEYMYDWRFPWSWRETVDLIAEIINEVVRETEYTGWLLCENLWWPGSFRLDGPEEIDYLLERVSYPKTGVMFDTGHLLNKNQEIRTEEEGIRYLLESMKQLGDLGSAVRGIHLTRSLSADYVRESQSRPNPLDFSGCHWVNIRPVLEHVQRIDEHEAFEHPDIAELLELVDPEFVVFEFLYRTREEWFDKIRRQKAACARTHFRQAGDPAPLRRQNHADAR